MDQLRLKVRDLELALGQNDDNLAVTFRLTPVLKNLLGLLLALQVVTPEIIRQRLEIAPDAKVAIHRLRKHLEPWEIQIQSRRNVGYWLEEQTKEQVRAYLDGGGGGDNPGDTPIGNALIPVGSEETSRDDEFEDDQGDGHAAAA